jgi:hypothetical protein
MTQQIGSTLIGGQDKQNRTQQGQNHRTTQSKYGEGHADQEEAQAGDQVAAVEDQ